MNPGMPFGQWLREQRTARGMTLEALAGRVGCSLWAIQKIETGARRPSPEVARLLAQVLDIPPDEQAAFIRFARADTADAAAPVMAPALSASTVPPAPMPMPPASVRPPPGPPASAAPPPAPPASSPATLPTYITSLIGRQAEVQAISARLREERRRLLTLTGPPGIGKTRLAVAVAERLAGQGAFPDGVFFVPLARLAEPGLVLPTLAHMLGLEERPHQALAADLAGFLREKRLLLVLDNFEHLLSAAPVVADLLKACPTLRVLATSREALNLHGEQLFPVPALAVPDDAQLARTPPEQLFSYPALALFRARADTIRPGQTVTVEEAAPIAQICARLDGLPLAIELAAARTRVLTPPQMLARLDQSLRLLIGGARDLPLRQQTLRAAIDWSYDLLAPGERVLFARLGVFAGEYTPAAVEAIGNARQDLPFDVLEGLAALVDKSLVRQVEGPDAGLRFMMLGMIREYALERLEERGEAATLRRLHAEYFLALAEAAEDELRRPNQIAWFARIEQEYPNFRAALAWAGAQPDPEMELRLAGALSWFWHPRTHIAEGLSWLRRALARPAVHAAGPARVRALIGAALLAFTDLDFAELQAYGAELETIGQQQHDDQILAWAYGMLGMYGGGVADPRTPDWFAQSVALFRQTGDAWGAAWFLNGIGLPALAFGDLATAHAVFAESVAAFERLGDRWGGGVALTFRGHVAAGTGDLAGAQQWYARALANFTAVGDRQRTHWAHINLGQVAWRAGRAAEAHDHYQVALAFFRDVGWPVHTATVLRRLGMLALSEGDLGAAAAAFAECLAIFQALGDRAQIAFALEDLAAVFLAAGPAPLGAERAAQILGAVDTLYAEIGPPFRTFVGPPLYMLSVDAADATRAGAEAQLGPAFATAWAAGQARGLPAMIAAAGQWRAELLRGGGYAGDGASAAFLA